MTDPLLDRLAAPSAPRADRSELTDLTDRLVDRWLRAPGPLGDVLVVVGAGGVRYLRDAATGEDAFRHEYRRRFSRPVLASTRRAPAGLLPALRGRPGRPDVDLGDATGFERAVLAATARIPVGETRPYGWVAREAGRPRAVRAVGTVLARNPVPLLVPCHRVTRADGHLGDYMFGAPAKATLLRAEDADVEGLAALADRGVTLLGSDTTGVVCFPSCHHARRITDAHRREFRSPAAALAAGYRPCRACRPATPAGPG